MPRKPLIRTSEFPYHVYTRSNNREWFQIPIDDVWKIFSYYLNIITKMYGLEIGSFVLMSNHFHMIVWTPNENLDQAMHYLLREVSKTINSRAGRKDHLFGAPYKWCLITTEEYLSQVYKYNYQNPLVKDLCETVEDYPFSTLYYIENKLKLPFPLFEEKIIEASEYISKNHDHRIKWLNERYTDLQREAIALGSKKSIFKLPTYNHFRNLFKKSM